jgi:hypothetical protein
MRSKPEGGGEVKSTITTSALVVSGEVPDTPPGTERVYVGIDLGYREHVAAATPVWAFNPQCHPDGWKRAKTLKFSSDAPGYQKLQRYLERLSADPSDFRILLEPTGGYLRPEPHLAPARQRLSCAAGR